MNPGESPTLAALRKADDDFAALIAENAKLRAIGQRGFESKLIAENERLRAAVEALLSAYAPGADITAQQKGEDALHSSVRLARAALEASK